MVSIENDDDDAVDAEGGCCDDDATGDVFGIVSALLTRFSFLST